MKRPRYEIVVGNIGTVYSGTSKSESAMKWITYVDQSKSGLGRAGNEPVTMFCDGEDRKGVCAGTDRRELNTEDTSKRRCIRLWAMLTTRETEMTLLQTQRDKLIDLLWDYLKKDPEHKDRRMTGWGTKTKLGLIACIERLGAEAEEELKLQVETIKLKPLSIEQIEETLDTVKPGKVFTLTYRTVSLGNGSDEEQESGTLDVTYDGASDNIGRTIRYHFQDTGGTRRYIFADEIVSIEL